MSSEWISVKERLPKTSGAYLVYDSKYRDILIAIFNPNPDPGFLSCNDKWEPDLSYVNGWEYDAETINVTHWMDLPDIPKEYKND